MNIQSIFCRRLLPAAFLTVLIFPACNPDSGESENRKGATIKAAVPPQGFWVTSELKSSKSGMVLAGEPLHWDFKNDGTFQKIFDKTIIEEGKYSVTGDRLTMESNHGYKYDYQFASKEKQMTLDPKAEGDTTYITLDLIKSRSPDMAPDKLKRMDMQNF